VLFAGEPFLLSCSDNPPVDDQRGGTIVIKGGYAEDLHSESGNSEQRVDERGDDAALSYYKQQADYQHHQDDWKQPELFSFLQETPQLGKKGHGYLKSRLKLP
jgi:hypothetical protein